MAACSAWLSMGSTLRVGSSRSRRGGRQRQTLLHSRGASVEAPVDERLELECGGELSQALRELPGVQSVHGGEERQVLPSGEAPIEAPLFTGHQPDRSPHVDLLAERVTGYHGFPTVGYHQS